MNQAILKKVMSELGRRTSSKKALASRENGKKGGRPKKNRSQVNSSANMSTCQDGLTPEERHVLNVIKR
jgi:hypothetical protein